MDKTSMSLFKVIVPYLKLRTCFLATTQQRVITRQTGTCQVPGLALRNGGESSYLTFVVVHYS